MEGSQQATWLRGVQQSAPWLGSQQGWVGAQHAGVLLVEGAFGCVRESVFVAFIGAPFGLGLSDSPGKTERG